MSIAAGRFRTPVQVERIVGEADESGRPDLTLSSSWRTRWSGRAEVLAITARERIYSEQPVHDITHRVTVRKTEVTASIRARDRVVLPDGRVLNISGIAEVGNPARLIELACTEVR